MHERRVGELDCEGYCYYRQWVRSVCSGRIGVGQGFGFSKSVTWLSVMAL